ncbi:MAG TPA: GrpB family protein, partial [Acidimicrobiales bacterium]|nr:GrpB family protein [Acidimicrobiales bacterium]
SGWCWVAGGDGAARAIGVGYAATWEEGEEHETWTEDDPMSAFVLEGDFSVWATKVVGEPIVVEEYDERWPEWFEQIRDHVLPAFEGMPVAIEHVGSTAVPGLAAKPVIDVDVVVPTEGRVKAAVDRLETIGYLHRGDLGIAGREAFVSAPGLPRHHLYVVVEGSKAHLDHVLLRDHLRHHPADLVRYADLKKRNAAEVGGDMEEYVARKHDLVTELLDKARANRNIT